MIIFIAMILANVDGTYVAYGMPFKQEEHCRTFKELFPKHVENRKGWKKPIVYCVEKKLVDIP